MARRQYHGEMRLSYVPTIADPAAPTVAEVETAGVHLTHYLTMDGFGIPDEGATVDLSDAGSRQNKTARGRTGGGTGTVVAFRGDVPGGSGDDEAYETLTRDTDGYFVVRWFGGTDTAFVAADVVTVVPIQVISRPVDDIGDKGQTFTANYAIPDEVQYDVPVGA